jgi:hypothetical protein
MAGSISDRKLGDCRVWIENRKPKIENSRYEFSYYIIPVMRWTAALMVAATVAMACGPSGLFQQYEYEEDVYLSLDGSATIYVNGSLAAINALRGASFDASSGAPFDRAKIAKFYSTPVTHGVSVTSSRRSGRRFAHVRLDVDDIRQLGRAAPFAWSSYQFERERDGYVFRQSVGRAAGHDVGDVGWSGRERVTFRLHLPSTILATNAALENRRRGNILVWEQSLEDRQRSVPLVFDARMQAQSILSRTLWLFGVTFAAVAAAFGVAIWWVLRRGAGVTDQTSVRSVRL